MNRLIYVKSCTLYIICTYSYSTSTPAAMNVRVLPTLVGSGQLQPPLSNFYHHSGLIYHHSQGIKSAEIYV